MLLRYVAMLGDADKEGSVLLVGELSLHALGGKVALDKHCRGVPGTGQAKGGVERLRSLGGFKLKRWPTHNEHLTSHISLPGSIADRRSRLHIPQPCG